MGLKMHKCPFCDFQTNKIFVLKLHITKKHKNGYCPICGKRVKSLNSHIFLKVLKAKDKKHIELYHLFFKTWKMQKMKIEVKAKC